MTLPVDGALYYLHHVNGDKYVHPKGGSDTPGNDNPLVYHEPVGRLALQFYFTTDGSGYRQLVHYGSGRFIHPKGGHVGNNVALVTYDGSDGARTSVTMAIENGVSYLKNGGNASYYVHPYGGSITPGDDTGLVYFNEVRPGIAVEIVPAEEYNILSINFDQNAISKLAKAPVVVDKTITNSTDSPVTSHVTLSYEKSVTNTFQFSFTEKLGVKVTNTAKTNLVVGEASVSVEVSFEFSATQTQTTSTTEGVSVSSTEDIVVAPGKTVKVSLITTSATGNVPFTAVVQSKSRGQQITIHGNMNCDLFFDQKVTQQYV